MIYRINKTSDNTYTSTVGREGIGQSLEFSTVNLENFVFMNVDINDPKVNLSYEYYKTDYVVVKEYEVAGKHTLDEYYFNVKEFSGDEHFQNILNRINDLRINKSSVNIINAYLKDDVESIDKDEINVSDEEFKEFVYENSNKIMKILGYNYDFKDPKLSIYSCFYTLSVLGMISAVPVLNMVDAGAGIDIFVASALVCIVSCNLKYSRKNALIIKKLLEIYQSPETEEDFIRRRTKINE